MIDLRRRVTMHRAEIDFFHAQTRVQVLLTEAVKNFIEHVGDERCLPENVRRACLLLENDADNATVGFRTALANLEACEEATKRANIRYIFRK